jgi:hypothetical protein
LGYELCIFFNEASVLTTLASLKKSNPEESHPGEEKLD